MSDNKRIIFLEKSQDATRVEDNKYFIHQEAYVEFKSHVETILKRIEKNTKQDYKKERGHYTVTILGSRGSGKTTFALNALEKISSNECDLKSLGILDPTLMDTKEHVLIAVISLIKEEVEKFIRCGKIATDTNQCHDIFNRCDSETTSEYESWKKSLKKLAEGLKQLNGLGSDTLKHEMWDDPITLMEDGLTGAKAGYDLDQSLHQFIHKSSNMLGVKAFILALDDIDTSFEKGWPVLEILRKYLTTPRLIPVLCGDVDLYSTLVRKEQWKQLGDLPTEYDTKHLDSYEKTVRRLEEQYLLKIIPPRNRIELLTLAELDWKNLYIAYGDDGEGKEFKDVVEKLFEDYAGLTKHNSKSFIEHLSQQPLRLVISFLSTLLTIGEEKNDSEKQALINHGIAQTFFTSLSDTGLSFQRLRNFHTREESVVELMSALLKISDEQGDIFELSDTVYEEPYKQINLALTFLLYGRFKYRKGDDLGFMLRSSLLHQAMKRSGIEKDALHKLFSLDRNIDAISFTRLWAAVAKARTVDNTKQFQLLGTVQIYTDFGMNKRSNPTDVNKYFTSSINKNVYKTDWQLSDQQKKIRNLSENLNSVFATKYYAILKCMSTDVGQTNNATLHISVLPLIALASELLLDSGVITKIPARVKALELKKDIENKAVEQKKNSSKEIENDDYNDDEDESVESKQHTNTADTDLTKWAKDNKTVSSYPPQFYISVMDRFFNALEEMENRQIRLPLGILLRIQVAAFLNVLLIEEAIFHKQEEVFQFDPRNPIRTTGVYDSNVKKFDIQKAAKSSMRLYKELSTFPPFKYLLEDVQDLNIPNTDGSTVNYSFRELLDTMALSTALPK
ncbi:MAG: hypothetical protein M0P91_14005 [Sulfuricurvum sp.]|jgi:hypothetical protein|uniref:hypothetical protein n=1 Tax=Sulfuricurvum sp. TaxID=2025608 RepID=UPI0025F9E266|nr:hypothetical protein [Sulfuricurvum sp.]MCK9374291.1 hypothetical protein [Sulfuricurvum sp.]